VYLITHTVIVKHLCCFYILSHSYYIFY